MFGKLFNKVKYKFSDPTDTACVICCHVLNDSTAILYVSHDYEDRTWQFLCGADNHKSEEIRMISLNEAVSLDSTINQLHEMPVGVGAKRNSKHSKWQAFKL